MISAAELALMQAAVNSILDVSITIKRESPTLDATGLQSQVWNTITTVNGAIGQPTGTLMQNYDYLIGALDTWLVSLPVGTNVKQNDRLVTSTQTMRVEVILQPESLQVCILMLASAIEGGPA